MKHHIEYKLELARKLKDNYDQEVRKQQSDSDYFVCKQLQQYWTGKVEAFEEVLECLQEVS